MVVCLVETILDILWEMALLRTIVDKHTVLLQFETKLEQLQNTSALRRHNNRETYPKN